MDRQRARIAACAFAFCLGAAAAGAATVFPIRAARWIAPHADVARLLSEKPSECLAAAAAPDEAYRIEVGRAAFNTPLLLGGQASRAGLQCESCHRGGRTNPEFFFPHVSGRPGTADVTTSVFSSHRGDGIDNPKPIPDLSGPRGLLKVSRDPKKPDLKNFIHGLVTEEFDGAEPPPAVMEGLAAYVRHLTPEACPQNPVQPVRMQSVMNDEVRAARAARAALARKDGPTAILMLSSARSQLGLVFERYQGPALAGERAALRSADLDLASLQEEIRAGRPNSVDRLAIWLGEAEALTRRLAPGEESSLFIPAKLARATRRMRVSTAN